MNTRRKIGVLLEILIPTLILVGGVLFALNFLKNNKFTGSLITSDNQIIKVQSDILVGYRINLENDNHNLIIYNKEKGQIATATGLSQSEYDNIIDEVKLAKNSGGAINDNTYKAYQDGNQYHVLIHVRSSNSYVDLLTSSEQDASNAASYVNFEYGGEYTGPELNEEQSN